mgnify:FL=1
METLENRLQKKFHVFLYALVFLTVLLGLSVLLEGCMGKEEQNSASHTALSAIEVAKAADFSDLESST